MGRSGERFKEVRSPVVVREGFLEEVPSQPPPR